MDFGVGKSTFLTILSIYMTLGRNWMFFIFQRPLRVMILQAEDSENKLKKMGRMGLSESEIKLVNDNARILTIRDKQGEQAIKLPEQALGS
jgi:RecA-family ATPase